MSSNTRHFVIASALVIVATYGVHAILHAIYILPEAASTQAQPIDQLFTAHFWLIAFLFSLVVVFMMYALFVFRRKPGDEGDGEYTHGNTTLEVTWTVLPLILVVGFGVWGSQVLVNITAPAQNEMVVKVTGQQWDWSFEYPAQNGVKSNELVLPVNQPVRFEMQALDVLHSFWLPEFRVKQDLVPGRTTVLHITPTQVGDYELRCAEICGLSHSAMRRPVRVVSAADFQTWVVTAQQLPSDPVARGAVWYQQFGCSACHSLDGSALAGPTWQGLYLRQEQLTDGATVTADDDYIRTSILNPALQVVAGYAPNVMPANFADRFAETEAQFAGNGIDVDVLEELLAYIKTIQ